MYKLITHFSILIAQIHMKLAFSFKFFLTLALFFRSLYSHFSVIIRVVSFAKICGCNQYDEGCKLQVTC